MAAKPTTAAAMASAVSNVPIRLAAGAGAGRGAGAAAGAGRTADAGPATVGLGDPAAGGGTLAGRSLGRGGGALDGAAGAAPGGGDIAGPADGAGPDGGNDGSFIVALGLGGKLIRTVSFLGWTLAASEGFGGTPPGGGVGTFSGISK